MNENHTEKPTVAQTFKKIEIQELNKRPKICANENHILPTLRDLSPS
jgi:hypothetical protein